MYGVSEAVHQMSVSRSTIFTYIASGELASVRVGTRRLIAHADIVDFIRRHRTNENASAELIAGSGEAE
jgi:excisionase family DNA binding protein